MTVIRGVNRLLFVTLPASALLLAVAATGAEPPAGPDAEATAILRRTTRYLGELDRFSVDGHGMLEVVLTNGQKLQYDHDVSLTLDRPDKLRATRKGQIADQDFRYDGKTLTLFDPAEGVYAVQPVPPTLEGMLDFSRERLDIVAPAADLVYADAFERLTDGMTEGFVVSDSAWVNGEETTHLAFRKPGVDVQVWVANGGRPLPLKYVLTTTDMASSPQYILTLSNWDTDPDILADTFTFTPPAGAKRIEFLKLPEGPPIAD